MEGKKCKCRAIRLTENMLKAYEYFREHIAGNPVLVRKRFQTDAKAIYKHLNNEFEAGEYTEKQEPYYGLLEGMRKALAICDLGDDLGSQGMEVVRNAIHLNDELKQLMACGRPYTNKESLTETAKVLGEAFSAFAGTSPDPIQEARASLDRQYEKLSCASE